MRSLDLGPCAAALHEGDPERCVIILPGALYPTSAPLLWFAREASQQRGLTVVEVRDELKPDADAWEWAQDRAERALAATAAERVVVIGKSLASAATGIIADRRVSAAWLTPLLDQPTVIDGLRRASRRTLLVGGSLDPTWVRAALPANPVLETVEVDGTDHSLQVPRNAAASLCALGRVTARVGDLLDRELGP